MPHHPVTSTASLSARRRALGEALAELSRPALLCAGHAPARNYPGNPYPFRASSHFLFFAGRALEGAALLIDGDRSILFAAPPDPEDALWHGARPSFDQLKEAIGVDEVQGLPDLAAAVTGRDTATIPPQDHVTAQQLTELLGRPIPAGRAETLTGGDAALADAIIACRLTHDDAALTQIRYAARVSVEAHLAGMKATRPGRAESRVHAAMIEVFRRQGCADAYDPIVTTHGEVLHQRERGGKMVVGDLILADVGAESPEGWASDITRTWPVSGAFSETQRAIYDVVLEAQHRAIDAVRPGRSYRQVHEAAKRAIVEGLVDLKIFRGEVDGLLERGAAALFFPHGVGHILGLDVHDMEDLGDRAGYAPGRTRSEAFGDAFLRLDRDLEPGMVVTVEPGFYQVPGILDDAERTAPLGKDFQRDVLEKYADVRGIRIEDDVLVTQGDPDVLTGELPKKPEAIEEIASAS